MASSPITAPRPLFCVAMLLLTVVAGPHPASAQPAAPSSLADKRVLVLHAHEAQAPLFIEVDRALSNALSAGGVPLANLFFESLDLRRNPDPAYRKGLLEQLRLKYRHRPVDVIVTIFPEALAFVLNEARALFAGTPIVALYMPADTAPPTTAASRRIFWHAARLDVRGTLEIALTLVPAAKRVFVVSGAHPVERHQEARARVELQPWENRLEFRYVSGLPMAAALLTLAGSPSDGLVLLLPMSFDGAGRVYYTPEVAEQVARASPVPVFGVLDASLGGGIVGGMLHSFQHVGTRAGRRALEILQGGPANDVGSRIDVPPVPMFDWRALKRWHLSVDRLPPDSTIINREYTFWERYRAWAIGAGVVLLLQGLVIAALLIQRRERRLAEAAQRVSEEKFVKAFAGNPAGIILTRLADAVVLEANEQALQLLKYRREQMLGRSVLDLGVWVDPAQRTRYVDELRAAGRLRGWEVQFADARGQTLEVLLSAELIEVAGQPLILSTFLDVTERRRAQAESKRLRRDLAHISRVTLMGELTGSIAHELRQPLTAIASNAFAGQRYLAQPAPPLDEVREILGDVAADAGRAGEVIDRLRGLLKKDQSRFCPLNLNEVIEEAVTLAQADAIIRHRSIALVLAADLPPVVGDRVQLQQVLLNLILNGMDAMASSAEGQLTIYTTSEPTAVRVGVQDQGHGIPPEQLEQVFATFFTTKERGMGMGLAISRSIVEAHGGKIWAENNAEGGATFWFALPAQPPAASS